VSVGELGNCSLERCRRGLIRLARIRLARFLDAIVRIRFRCWSAHVLMRATVLFHIILASEGLIALWTVCVLLARVLFRMTRRMTGSSEVVCAIVLLGHWARILVFLGCMLAGGAIGERGHARL